MSKFAVIARRTGFSALVAIVLAAITASILYCAGVPPYRVYIVHTGSMGNTIPSGSAVIVREHEYHVGQVVSFTIAGEVVTHRLIKITDGQITTKGDANLSADPQRLPESNIIGGVVAAPRNLGFALQYFRLPFGIASAVLFVVLLWLCWTFPGPEETITPDKSETTTAVA